MSDLELLELAAKAAKFYCRVRYCEPRNGMVRYTLQDGYFGPTWNPLKDDGDALRLAVKLSLQPLFNDDLQVLTIDFQSEPGSFNVLCEMFGDDKQAATRRAIVRAAAEIGKSL